MKNKIEQFAKAVAVTETFQRHPLRLDLKNNVEALAEWFDKAKNLNIENELDEMEEHLFVLREEFEDVDDDAAEILEANFVLAKETLEAFENFKAS